MAESGRIRSLNRMARKVCSEGRAEARIDSNFAASGLVIDNQNASAPPIHPCAEACLNVASVL